MPHARPNFITQPAPKPRDKISVILNIYEEGTRPELLVVCNSLELQNGVDDRLADIFSPRYVFRIQKLVSLWES